MKSKIQGTDMKYLRWVKGIPRRDKIRSKIVREELGAESILHTTATEMVWISITMRDNQPVKEFARLKHRSLKPEDDQRKPGMMTYEIFWRKEKSHGQTQKTTENKKEWEKFVHTQKWMF